jgi:hypothetical protein
MSFFLFRIVNDNFPSFFFFTVFVLMFMFMVMVVVAMIMSTVVVTVVMGTMVVMVVTVVMGTVVMMVVAVVVGAVVMTFFTVERTAVIIMSMSPVRMVMEKEQANQIYNKTSHRHKQQFIAMDILRLVNPLNRLNENIEGHKNQKHSIIEA